MEILKELLFIWSNLFFQYDEDGGGNRELDGYNNDDDEDMKMASHLGRSA